MANCLAGMGFLQSVTAGVFIRHESILERPGRGRRSVIISHLSSQRLKLRAKKLYPDAKLPRFAHGPEEDARMDLQAVESAVLTPGGRASVGCGIALEIPPGYEGQVRPRSDLAFKQGIPLVNAPGTIDPGYRGEVRVLLINLGSDEYEVEPGERVAQLVIGTCTAAEWNWVESVRRLGSRRRRLRIDRLLDRSRQSNAFFRQLPSGLPQCRPSRIESCRLVRQVASLCAHIRLTVRDLSNIAWRDVARFARKRDSQFDALLSELAPPGLRVALP